MTRNGAMIVHPVVDSLVAELIRLKIDIIKIDPFVSSHTVPENDNGAMDMVVKEWGKVADRANCAVELSHHPRKTNGSEVTAEDSRGGSSFASGTRVKRPLNRMTPARSTEIEFAVPDLRTRLLPCPTPHPYKGWWCGNCIAVLAVPVPYPRCGRSEQASNIETHLALTSRPLMQRVRDCKIPTTTISNAQEAE